MQLTWTMALLFTLQSLTGYSFQQQWTDGPGIEGPVSQWLEGFWQSDGVAWWEFDPTWDGPHSIQLIHYHQKTVDEDFGGVSSLDVLDVDGDGDPDIISASESLGEVVCWRNGDGSGTFWSRITVDADVPGAVPVRGADIDGDGSMDIVGASTQDHAVYWWRNLDGSGGSWSRRTILDDYLFPMGVETADVDDDGDQDVICASGSPNAILWMENTDGMGLDWISHEISGSVLLTRTLEVCDMDGDGDTDILASVNGPDTSWWENFDGSGTSWQKHTIETLYSIMQDITVADVDDDGDLDVIGTNDTGSWKVNGWRNLNGTGTQWERFPIGGQALNAPGSSSLHPLDFDGDGDVDIAAASANENTVKVWINGDGSDWHRAYIQGAFDEAADISSADFDGDGTPDLVSPSAGQGTVVWWKDSSYTDSGWLESSIDRNRFAFYQQLEASYEAPPGTSVLFQLRASDDSTDLGPWSDTLTAPCDLTGLIADGDYLQYRILLSTEDTDTTPLLRSILVNWGTVGIETALPGVADGLIGPLRNPSVDPVIVRFSVPQSTSVAFFLYDLSGRMVRSIAAGVYPAGEHDLVFSGLPPGAYSLQMRTDGHSSTCRIVVVRP